MFSRNIEFLPAVFGLLKVLFLSNPIAALRFVPNYLRGVSDPPPPLLWWNVFFTTLFP